MALFSVALFGGFSFLVDANRRDAYLAATLSATATAVFFLIRENDGSYTFRRAKDAEEWTADLLARIGGWRSVHGLYFEGVGDVDHVAFGVGGVLAVETKFSEEPRQLVESNPVLMGQVRQAQRSARKVRHFLTAIGDVPVLPVLVLWTHEDSEALPGTAHIDGVFVVAPERAATGWSKQLHHDELDEFTVNCIDEHLTQFATIQKRRRVQL